MNRNNSLNQLQYSKIQDHNRYPQTDFLYQPLRKILLRPQQLTESKQFLNTAVAHSRVSRDFAYLSYGQVRQIRQKTLIPVDQPLIPTQNFQKIKNNRFIVIDAKQSVIGAPISAQQFRRIHNKALKQQRIVYNFSKQQKPVSVRPLTNHINTIKQQYTSNYTSPRIQAYRPQQKYKYNLFSILDHQFNNRNCQCPNNQIIASRK